jgi:hypothetical protein
VHKNHRTWHGQDEQLFPTTTHDKGLCLEFF